MLIQPLLSAPATPKAPPEPTLSSASVSDKVTLGANQNNTTPVSGHHLRNVKGTVVGAGGGAALGGGIGYLAGGALGTAIGGAVGALLGGYIGNNIVPLAYNMKAVGRWLQGVGEAARGKVIHLGSAIRAQKGPLPLGPQSLRAAQATGESNRKFDGYDASRNIFAVYSEEGDAAKPYTFQAEMSNLREGAEHGHLDTVLLLDWGDAGGQKALPFGLQSGAAIDPWKAAVRVEDNHHGTVIDANGNPLSKPLNAYHSTTFGTVQFQVDKAGLRDLGWKDGQPLRMQFITAKEGDRQIADRLAAASDVKASADKVFRWEGKVVYYAVTDRFHDGDKTNNQDVDPKDPERFHGGDWQGIIDKLDYIKSLGTDCVWISCPYLNDKNFFGKDGFHGYWPHDFGKPEPHFGDMAKLRELAEKCHEKGMKLMLDVVVNHTGYNHPMVTDPRYSSWFHKEGDVKSLGQYQMEHGALAGLPDLDQENPDCARYLIDVHKWWLTESGADAFREDAVRHVPEKFLRQFNKEMHETKPGFISIGESFWLDPNFDAGYQNRTMDSVFDFPLAFAMRDVFASDAKRGLRDRIKIAREFFWNNPNEAMRELVTPNGGSMNRLAVVLKENLLYDNPKKLGTLVDNHDMIRFMSDCGGDTRKLEIATAFMMGARGIPCVYYGTEVGMEGMAGANRNDMEFDKNPALTDRFRRLTHARGASAALQYGTQRTLKSTHYTFAYERMRPGEEVICVFNNSDKEKTVQVPLDRNTQIAAGDELRDLIGGGTTTATRKGLNVTLPPKGYAYYQWQR